MIHQVQPNHVSIFSVQYKESEVKYRQYCSSASTITVKIGYKKHTLKELDLWLTKFVLKLGETGIDAAAVRVGDSTLRHFCLIHKPNDYLSHLIGSRNEHKL